MITGETKGRCRGPCSPWGPSLVCCALTVRHALLLPRSCCRHPRWAGSSRPGSPSASSPCPCSLFSTARHPTRRPRAAPAPARRYSSRSTHPPAFPCEDELGTLVPPPLAWPGQRRGCRTPPCGTRRTRKVGECSAARAALPSAMVFRAVCCAPRADVGVQGRHRHAARVARVPGQRRGGPPLARGAHAGERHLPALCGLMHTLCAARHVTHLVVRLRLRRGVQNRCAAWAGAALLVPFSEDLRQSL